MDKGLENIDVDCHISIIHKDSDTFKNKKENLEKLFKNLTIDLHTFVKEDISKKILPTTFTDEVKNSILGMV